MNNLLEIAWFSMLYGVVSTSLEKHVTTVAPSLCPELATTCKCNSFNELINVNCYNVDDLESIVETVNRDFANQNINHIYLNNATLTEIPSRAFGNLTLNIIIFKKGIIGNLSDDAFLGIMELEQLLWEFIPGFDRIPQAVLKQNLTLLRLIHSDVSSVGQEIQNMTTLQVMDLQYNKITTIHPQAFLNCIALRQVILNNNQIQQLDRHIFQNVHNLDKLHIEGNQLTSLDGVLEPTALTIQEVFLANNSFTSLKTIFNSKAPNLNKLILSGNPLKRLASVDFNNKFIKLTSLFLDNTSLVDVGRSTFSGLPQLQQLYLRKNNLTGLPVSLFPYSIKEVYLGFNLLTNISGVFKNFGSLTILSLDSNKFKDIGGMFDSMPVLKQLTLSYNLIESIPNGTFANLPVLEFLSLGSNRITQLCNGSFIGLKQKLFLIDLSNNLIENLGGAFSNKKTLPQLKKLWLFNNSLQALSQNDFFLENVNDINLSRNKLTTLKGAFFNLKNLRNLNVQYNQLETISRDNLPYQINVKYLLLIGNPLSCDCRILWLVDSFHTKGHHHVSIDRTSVCAAPHWLNGTYIHKLRPRQVIKWEDDCPTECEICKCYPRWGEITIYVDCQSRNLTSIPSVYPEKTLLLNLSDNSLKQLPRELASYVPNLETLDLRRNFITTLDGVDLPLGLKALNLSENNATVFPKDALKNLELTNVEVSGNPWLCDCNANDFRLWLLKNNHVVQDINETQCSKSDTNGQLGGKKITSLTELDLCPVRVALYAVIAIGILAVLLSGAGGFIGYIRYKMPIKVWLYTNGLCLRWVKEEDIDENKEYDAFLAFSTEEQHCVYKILEELEKKPPFFKLCVHYRDFIGGELILENIARAVKSSKKTVILLSKTFLESEWTMQEFRQANYQTMEEKINRIVLVLVGELPDDDRINEDVRAYLKTATYLRWEDKYLWQKLRYAMPKNPVPRDENTGTVNWSDNERQPLLPKP